MALQIKQTENVTVEQIEAEEKRLATLKANLELQELQTKGIQDFKESASKVNSVDEIYKLASNFKWRVEKIKRVLSPPAEGTSKRGRPAKETQATPAKPNNQKHR